MANSFTITPDDEEEESSFLDTVKEWAGKFVRFALGFLILLWIVLELFYSKEKAIEVSRSENEVPEDCPQVRITDADKDLVASMMGILNGMEQGNFRLTGTAAEEFGACYLVDNGNESDKDRVMTLVFFDKDNRQGLIRYKWGIDWIVQFDFREDYICKSIEMFGKRFNGNILAYIWNHTVRRFLWTHPRYLCVEEDRYVPQNVHDRYYVVQTVGHQWLSFTRLKGENTNPDGYVSTDMRIRKETS